jgi:NAD(P)-dependent dehydrogenase (short-subunit alcohol dehydrogenase family)
MTQLREGFPEGAVLVFGGSGGIGRAVCEAFSEAGVPVAFTYFGNTEAADELVAALSIYGGDAAAYRLDLRDPTAIGAVVYAAGPDLDQTYFSQIDEAAFRRVVETDVHGFFAVAQAAVPVLKEGGGGSITAVTSAGLARYPARDALSVVPKAAVETMVRAIAVEEGKFGVRANTVAPGVIDAGVFHRLRGTAFSDALVEEMRRNTALRRFGTAREVADTVLFLASSRAGFITGQRLVVDGGFSI